MSEELMPNVTFAELYVGQSAAVKRILTQRDVELFAAVSGDLNPSHLDKDFAKSIKLDDVVGHSMWSGSLISNVLGTVLPGPGTTYLEQDLKFQCPVRVGDEITARVTVRSKHATEPIVVFDCVCSNALGEKVMTGTATVLAPLEKYNAARPELPNVQVYARDKYREILARAKKMPKIKTAVVHPVSANAILAAAEAAREGLIEPVMVGPADRIKAAAAECKVDMTGWQIVDTEHSHASAAKSAQMAAAGDVDAIMKGSLHSDELLGAILPSAVGLRTKRRVSHAFVLDIPTYHKPLIITDAALNIAPDLDAKADIAQNAVNLWHILFGDLEKRLPKVGVVSAVETVTSKIPSTLDAACLCKMADRGQIADCIVDGPLAFDNAVSKQAAKDKGIVSEVAGDVDIIVVPNIETGNGLVKQMSFLGNAETAGIVLGAKVPVILTSRADSVRARILSCITAVFLANARKGGAFK